MRGLDNLEPVIFFSPRDPLRCLLLRVDQEWPAATMLHKYSILNGVFIVR